MMAVLWPAGAAGGDESGLPVASAYSESVDAQVDGQSAVTVQVRGVRSARGLVYVALHSERGYPFDRHLALAEVELPAAQGDMRVHLPLPASGRFGVIVFHDEDGSGDLTRNWLGLPSEGYVGGNNEQALNRPTFEKDSLELSADAVVDLTLWYP